ncbi:hypothetical protein MLD38_000028 [Melastoma candidum]|uniref:Uncharacterized protein n=1 Tax=Melastoma candidum TaxID=119954 RepID=A0ACB9SAC7_9MYRT|nr:hypothetical protein MLD38_000028 [Melastoma candidum]
MMTTHSSFISAGIFSAFPPPSPSARFRNGRPFFTLISSSSKNGDSSPDDTDARKPSGFVLRVPRYPTLVRSAVALFGLGFIDAGYSGDWSRIGVISRETEEMLRLAAFVVVPL